MYHSQALPGFWLSVAWLWEQPLPEATKALLDIDREGYGRYVQEKLRKAGM